jgi:hypothetical protein
MRRATTMARHAADLVDLATAERIDRAFRPDKFTGWRPADDFIFPPETLAADPDESVRLIVAPHRTRALIGLLADQTESVAHAAAESPFLPVHQMERLLALADL